MSTDPLNRLDGWQKAIQDLPVKKVQRYCLGFAFVPAKAGVVLIRKERPEWQAGKFNGVGGKVEDRELPIDGMVREFFEETGCFVIPTRWTERGALQGKEYIVYVYTCELGSTEEFFTKTDEEVQLKDVVGYTGDWLPHVEGLINLCLMSIGPEGARPYFQLYY